MAREAVSEGGGVEEVLDDALRGAVLDLPSAAGERLCRSGRATTIERDRPVVASDTQANPPWGLDRTDQRSLPMSGSYTYRSAGAGVTAYVVDSGIRADHVDFSGRVRIKGSNLAVGRTQVLVGRAAAVIVAHTSTSASPWSPRPTLPVPSTSS